MTSQSKAFCCAGLTILIWSTVSTAFKIALQSMSPLQLLAVSMITATICLAPLLVVRQGARPVRELLAARSFCPLLLPGVMLFAYYTLLFAAYDRLPAQIAQPVNMTWAIVLALFAALFLKQKLSARELGFMLLAYAGVVILAAGGTELLGAPDPLGMACVIASTALYALYWTVNARAALPPVPRLFCAFAVAGVLACAALALTGQGLRLGQLRPLWPAIYVGLFELAVPFLLWDAALRLSSSVSRISALTFLSPFLALVWIHLVVGEPIAGSTLLGLTAIVLGTLLQQRAAQQQAQKNAQDA